MGDRGRIRSIPTRYKGILFRSRLEASVAECLDACEVAWTYEQEGYDLGGEDGWYLPDFWLPTARQFIEVKGQIEDPSVEKPIRLARAIGAEREEEEWGMPASVVVMTAPFVARGLLGTMWGGYGDGLNVVFGDGYNATGKVDAVLVRCSLCGVPFFMTGAGAWTCTACGRWEKHYHNEILVRVEHVRGKTSYERAR